MASNKCTWGSPKATLKRALHFWNKGGDGT